MFDALTDRLQGVMKSLKGHGKLTAEDVDAAMREIRLALLEADVNFKVVREFVAHVKERALGAEVMESLTPAQQVVKIVNEELVELMGSGDSKLAFSGHPPTVILLAGLQGSGKTTACAKLAKLLKKDGKSPVLIAADIYRPAAIDQLQSLGELINVPVYAPGADVDPVDIARDGVDVGAGCVHGHVDALAQRLQLVDGRGSIDVGGDEHRRLAVLLEQLGELGAGGRLAGALQAGQEDHSGRMAAEGKLGVAAAHELDELFVHDLHDLLRRREALHDLRTERALLDVGDELAHHLEVDVGLEQRQADLAHGSVDVLGAELAVALETLHDASQAVGECVEHERPSGRFGERQW